MGAVGRALRMAEKIPNGMLTSEADRWKKRARILVYAPEAYSPTQPPRHKMVIVLVIVIVTQVSLMTPILSWKESLPLAVNQAVVKHRQSYFSSGRALGEMSSLVDNHGTDRAQRY